MTIRTSKTPKLFIAVLEGRPLVTSRFCPGRSKVDRLQKTVEEKKNIKNP